MNYLKLINQFWMLRRSKRITSKQADLYFFLLKECNERGWENPFECSNKSIVASIDIQEPTLIDTRNRLKQLGLIDFKAGKRNESSPVYELLYLNNLSRNRGESIDETEELPKKKPEPFNKTKQKETKQKDSSAPAEGEEKKGNEHWQVLVNTWFSFYKERFMIEPSFKGAEAKNLKSITDRLEKFSAGLGFQWTEAQAKETFIHFLQTALNHSDWLNRNFLLGNIASQFDAIINPRKNEQHSKSGSTSAGARKVTGADLNASLAKFRNQGATVTDH